MFVLNPSDICAFNLTHAKQFVDYWSKLYDHGEKRAREDVVIDYFAELNLESPLTEDNIRHLLRWKDRRRFTDPVLTGKSKDLPNPEVAEVLARRGVINEFRAGHIDESTMRNSILEVFASGIVFHVFLLHIAKPHMYPIADQHVYRAFSAHRGRVLSESWEDYCVYRHYFEEVAAAAGIGSSLNDIRDLKRVDDALMTFGQFLGQYA